MSDSSEEEDLSRFKEVVDTSFIKVVNDSTGKSLKSHCNSSGTKKSERYLETSSHYNDIQVPKEMQQRIAAKISAIINKNIEFVTVEDQGKKRKIKGGVKLFRDSDSFLSCEEAKDTLTEIHNKESKKIKNKKQNIDSDIEIQNEQDKLKSVAVTGEYVLSKEETKCWKSRRKEKLFRYKSSGKSKVLTAIE